MSIAWFPNSSTHKRLQAIAHKLHGAVATDFSGIIVNGHRVLYRHGQFAVVVGRKEKSRYGRVDWVNPFGQKDDREKVSAVLLHASQPEELFFFFPRKYADALAAAYPERLNIATEPLRPSKILESISAYQLSLSELRHKLRAR